MSPLLPFLILVSQHLACVAYFRQIPPPLVVQRGPVVPKGRQVGSAFRWTRRRNDFVEPAQPNRFRPEQMSQGLEDATICGLEIASQLFGRKLPGGLKQSGRRPNVVLPMLSQH